MPHKTSCHLGHPLKRRRAPNEYECDVCDKDVSTGKRLTEKHEAMVESFLASAVGELEGSVVPAKTGICSA